MAYAIVDMKQDGITTHESDQTVHTDTDARESLPPQAIARSSSKCSITDSEGYIKV